jgi:hypothetical protein
MAWFNVAGLVLDIVGALVLAWGLITMTEAEAIEQGQTVLGGPPGDPRNREIPRARVLLRDARFARWGLGLLIGGFLLQLIGSWPRTIR